MICEIDSWVLGGVQFGCLCRCCLGCCLAHGMLFGVLFEVLVMARAHFCEIDGRVLWEC